MQVVCVQKHSPHSKHIVPSIILKLFSQGWTAFPRKQVMKRNKLPATWMMGFCAICLLWDRVGPCFTPPRVHDWGQSVNVVRERQSLNQPREGIFNTVRAQEVTQYSYGCHESPTWRNLHTSPKTRGTIATDSVGPSAEGRLCPVLRTPHIPTWSWWTEKEPGHWLGSQPQTFGTVWVLKSGLCFNNISWVRISRVGAGASFVYFKNIF